MTAPAKSVAAVQEALGCEEEYGDLDFQANPSYCAEHVSGHGDHVLWTDRGCSVAVAAADAAVQAARPSIERAAKAEALRQAADRAPAYHDGNEPEWAITALCRWLRARADRIEAQRREDATG